ncbi:cobalt-precorrin-6B (C15)-methyltransferase [Dethiosulfatibacter aminovorans DSM 17477]|uniref:Glucose-inhibited division protein B n=1 Tax=Dethiosulfatibacter aminovorans DSM 17477 TaxID=1121476 RepID=A0A1M6B317_9FIRM|nr:precorrin-6Y C5,15-methyltransferase (decarboxylating) subunit CbiT [Dethiosulfatibacter aminovorans]SHI43096.1 cobalt-precorrin-6B (C15)-methyltransferase [Dethiosulfatibacter aminovorans DSM 17477]
MINRIVPGIDDDKFIREKAPMTKNEVRVVTCSKLNIESDSRILDIGGGTGSTSIEFASLSPEIRVTVIERNRDSYELILKNIDKFCLGNVRAIHGKACGDLPEEEFDRVFIGGSGGNMEDIFKWMEIHLVDGGTVVSNTVTIENLFVFTKLLKEYGYSDIDVTQMSVSKGKNVANLTMMIANNPIYIVSGRK